MKYLIILCLTVIGGFTAHGQLPNFPLHANGLLYDDTVMNRLRFIVDSLQLRTTKKEPVKAYYSLKQTTARLVRLDSGNVQGAFADLRNGMSLEDFAAKYPQAVIDNKILVVLDEHPGYQVAGNATYINATASDYSAERIILPTDEHYRPLDNPPHDCWIDVDHVGIKGNCVYYLSTEPHIYRGKGVNGAYLFAFYLDRVPAASELPLGAARLVGYRDRMLDTANGMYYKDAGMAGLDFRNVNFGPAQNAFDDYLKRMADPVVAAYHREHPKATHMDDFEISRRCSDSLAVDSTFKRLLGAAIAETERKGYYPFIFLERYMDSYSPRAALEIRRHWLPMATCGFDHLTGRLSEMHIAVLAAETGDWSVFLPAQLAIAIDPEGQHPDLLRSLNRTYFLRELEDLDIGADDILLGNLLSFDRGDASFNWAKRLGRAFALEARDKRGLEEKVSRLIADKRLDDYNRLALHYLFLNYISFLPDNGERNKAFSRLQRADEALPAYLSARVNAQKQAMNDRRDLALW